MPSGWKPCLEHMQRCPGLLVAFSLSLVSFKRVNFQGTWRGFCSLEVVLPGGMNMASYLISMVFEDFQPESPGVNVLARERPCLEHVQQSGMQVGQPLAHVLSLVFHWRQFKLSGVSTPSERKPCLEKPIPHQGLEVIPGIIIMSCTCFKLGFCPSTVQVVASYLISMVFEIRHPKSPGNNMPPERKPCLEHMQ